MAEPNIPRTLTIAWLREMYIAKALTPEAVIRTIIQRAREDEAMNIWISEPSMDRIKPYLDRLDSVDPGQLPLWGIPFAIKDNIDLAGVPTTAACPEFAYTPERHAAVVERMIAAGAIPVGKTNLDQFATGLVGVRSPYGETHNALRGELISGGSSSGSAVAVARGHAAFAFGTDTAGSGRVPAALNRLVGYKPSLGAWPTRGVVPACASLDCVTVFTQSLDDTHAIDAAARGVDSADPWSRSVPQPSSEVPAKICLPNGPLDFFGPYAEEYRRAWSDACATITAMNLPIEYVEPDLFARAAAILYDGPWVAERWADLGRFVDTHPGDVLPVTEQVLRSGNSERYTAASVFQAMHTLQEMKLAVRTMLEDAVLVMPTCGGTWTREEVRLDPIGTNSAMGKYTNHCNLLDLCAVAVPAGEAAADTPFGVTWFALAENEGLIRGASDLFVHGRRPAEDHRSDTIPVAVCGLHMRGFPLERQMQQHGARFVREAATAAKYQMVKLSSTPVKPGLIKQHTGGESLRLEIWEMPAAAFGPFAAAIPAPLGIGKVELEDGTEVPGFICEGYAGANAEDITAYGGWRGLMGSEV